MFKSNPNFNEYYGLIHKISHKSNKLKRTERSNEKNQYSKKSVSQDSRSEGQTSLDKRNKHLQDFMNSRKNGHQKKFNEEVNSPESPKELNILDLFKRKDFSGEQNLKKSVDLYPETRSKKYNGIDYNRTSSKKINQIKPAQKYELEEYFGDSNKLKNIRSDRNSSRSRSLRKKSQKSLFKMLKSKSRQELYSPVEKIVNIIKQEEKVRQQKIQNQQTLKHINYIHSLNELNETRMNFPAIKHFRSQQNLYEIELQSHKKKKNHNIFHHYETSNSKNLHYGKNELSLKKSLSKKFKATDSYIIFQSSDRQQQKPKISSSKITKYFNRKEQVEKDKMKMRNILQNIGTMNEVSKLRKIQSEQVLPCFNSEANNSQISQSMLSSNGQSSKNSMIFLKDISSKNGEEESKNQNESAYEYSEYGFEVNHHPYQQKVQNKKFDKNHKNDKSNSYEISQFHAGKMIDQIKSFESSRLKDFIEDSNIQCSQANSITSIEERMLNQEKEYKKVSNVLSQRSELQIKPSECEIIIHGPSGIKLQNQPSINTPTYRHNLTDKKSKQGIISKLKRDIAEEKMKSDKKIKRQDKKFNKKQSEISKKEKQSISSSYLSSNEDSKRQHANNDQSSHDKESVNNIKIESGTEEPKQKITTNLIDTNKDRQTPLPPPPELKYKTTWNDTNNKYETSKTEKQSKNRISNNFKVNGHDLSEFQSIESERRNSQRSSNADSMINSNKEKQAKSQQSKLIKKQNESSNKKSINRDSKNSEKQADSNKKPEEEKKTVKFLKMTKKSASIPNMQQSNIGSLTDSYQTESMTSSQTTLLASSASHSLKFPNSIQKVKIDQSKSKIIKEEEGSEGQSSKSESSIKMSQTSSMYTESVKTSKDHIQKITDSDYSQSSQSRVPTSNKILASRISQSNQNSNLPSSSNFQILSSSANNSNSISKSSSLSSASKKFANANKFNSLPKNESHVFKRKKNFAEYTLNDVARYIEEHEFRIESYCFYIDNSKIAYEEDYELQKIELLSFLMLKKNIFQLNKVIAALEGTGDNVFDLTGIEIIDEVLHDYRDREEITQQLNNIIKYQKQTMKEFQETYKSLEKKYNGEKGFNLSLEKDDFSSEIVKKLGQELNTLYEKWEKNKSLGDKITARKICQKLEKRMIEIIQLIFLTSQIDGKKVKPFQMLESQVQFLAYYEKWYERIIQTIEHFDQKSKYSN